MPARSIESLKRLHGSFMAVPREYTYFCRAHKGKPSVPARILRIYVYESKENDEYLSLSEGDLVERMDWEWSERTIATARRFLVRRGLLLSDCSVRSGCRSRLAVNRELLEQESQGLPANWERELWDYLRQKNRRRPRKAGQTHTRERPEAGQIYAGLEREAGQKYIGQEVGAGQSYRGTGVNSAPLSSGSGTNFAPLPAVSLTTQNITEEQEELASFSPVKNEAKAKAEHDAMVRREVMTVVRGQTIRGQMADQGTIGNLTKHLAGLRFEDRRMAWLEIKQSFKHASSWGLPVSIAQSYACGDGDWQEDAEVQLTSENCVATPPRVICGYRDMSAAEEEAAAAMAAKETVGAWLARKIAASEVSSRAEVARHG